MNKDDDVTLIPVAIASQAAAENVATIPATQATAGDGRVSIDLGYPPECAISVAAGGKYPEMQDANGVYKLLSSAIRAIQAWGILPFNAAFATAIGGYPKYAVCVDSEGAYWVSTADSNTSTPGTTDASWQSLFNGYATQAWANGQFLQLADPDAQTVTGPVAFSGATTVPSVTAFTGTDALNAETAEGRYVKSVPATGQMRITDLVENSDGRAVFGDGTNNPVLALLSDLPVDEWTSYNSYPCLIRTWPNGCIEQFFYVYMPISGVNTVAYPQAYPDGTLPLVFPGAGFRSIDNHTGTLAFNSQTPDRSAVTATGFSAQAYAYTIGPVTWAGWIHVMGPATEAAS